jgi:hypothetical protein
MRLGVSAARSPAGSLPVQHLAGRLVQQRGKECPVSAVESDFSPCNGRCEARPALVAIHVRAGRPVARHHRK